MPLVERRAAERRFRRTCVKADKQAWLTKCKALTALYEQKSCDYWRNEIAAGSVHTKRLWNTLHAVLGETRSEDVDAHTADEFAAFFRDKVASVRAACASTPLYDVPYRQGCRGYEISHPYPYPYPQIFRGYPWIYPYPQMPILCKRVSSK